MDGAAFASVDRKPIHPNAKRDIDIYIVLYVIVVSDTSKSNIIFSIYLNKSVFEFCGISLCFI